MRAIIKTKLLLQLTRRFNKISNEGLTEASQHITVVGAGLIGVEVAENLIKAGAMDWTGESRSGMTERLEKVIATASSGHRDKAAGQVAMFDRHDKHLVVT